MPFGPHRSAGGQGRDRDLLVLALDESRQGEVYSRVIALIDEIYGQVEKRQPLSTAKLRFQSGLSKLTREMRFRLGRLPLWELFSTWLKNLYGHIWFRTAAGKAYMQSLVEHSDTLVMDGRINTIMSGSAAQRHVLTAALDELEKRVCCITVYIPARPP